MEIVEKNLSELYRITNTSRGELVEIINQPEIDDSELTCSNADQARYDYYGQPDNNSDEQLAALKKWLSFIESIEELEKIFYLYPRRSKSEAIVIKRIYAVMEN